MPGFDAYRRSYHVLEAAQAALDEGPVNNSERSWATAVVLLRSPLANGTVTGAEFGYVTATIAAAAITELASVRRAARIRMFRYSIAFYALGLCSPITYGLLPDSWLAHPHAAIAAGIAHAALMYVAIRILSVRALRTFKPTPPPAPEMDHR